MENSFKIPLLRAMGHIYEASKGCQLKDTIWCELKESLEVTATYFGIKKMQAFLIAHIFSHNYNQKGTTISLLAEYLDCSPMRLLEYSGEIFELANLGMIRRESSRRRETIGLSNEELILDPKIEEAVLLDLPMPKFEPLKTDCFITLLERIMALEDELSDQKINVNNFMNSLRDVLNKNTHFTIIHQLDKKGTDLIDAFVFLRLVWEVLNGFNTLEVDNVISDILKRHSSRRVKYLQSFLKEENILQKLQFVKLKQSRFLNEAEIELADTAKNVLTAMGLHIEQNKEKRKDLIVPSSIAVRKLFFNPRETEELEMLQSMLMERNFKRLRTRLKKKDLPHGLTALFFGYPGTGKTESVLQMARRSGREIHKVDISQTKSMWFGESEKIIKKVFIQYRELAQNSKRTPILLFNEADAIISRRRNSSTSSVAQTENTIQNIILEELETFEGIFMATTNLVKNMDNAFERRFLFKIEFEKPLAEVKARIWKSKMPQLTYQQCLSLAMEFDFTGGQIDNIIRKCESIHVVYDRNSTIEDIIKLCQNESWERSHHVAIGFKRSI